MKLSNILNVETRPFDAATYEPAEEETVIDESGKRRVRLRDQNVIRWRVRPGGPDGGVPPAIESNARCAVTLNPTPYTLYPATHEPAEEEETINDDSGKRRVRLRD